MTDAQIVALFDQLNRIEDKIDWQNNELARTVNPTPPPPRK